MCFAKVNKGTRNKNLDKTLLPLTLPHTNTPNIHIELSEIKLLLIKLITGKMNGRTINKKVKVHLMGNPK